MQCQICFDSFVINSTYNHTYQDTLRVWFWVHLTATVFGVVGWVAVGPAVLAVDFVVAEGSNPLGKHRKRVLLDY